MEFLCFQQRGFQIFVEDFLIMFVIYRYAGFYGRAIEVVMAFCRCLFFSIVPLTISWFKVHQYSSFDLLSSYIIYYFLDWQSLAHL